MQFQQNGLAAFVFLGTLASAPLHAQQAPAPSPAEQQLTFEEANKRAQLPRWLSLKFAEFDTRGPEPMMDADLRAGAIAPDTTDYYIIQLDGPATEEVKAKITNTGVSLLDYIPNNAFIVRAGQGALGKLQNIGSIVWMGAFHPAYRIDARLRDASLDSRAADTKMNLYVMAFEGISRATFESQLTSRGARIVGIDESLGRATAEIEASPSIARWIAQAPDVQWVEPTSNVALRLNNNTKWVIQTNTTNSTKYWDAGIRGEGQVTGHIDGNLDMNSCFVKDPVNNTVGAGHRKVVYNSTGGFGSDVHGIHTAATMAGDQFPVNGSTNLRGMAYNAKIAHTILTNGSYVGSTFNSTSVTHANNGARVHTNSWGDDGTTVYNGLCNGIDSFQWNNEDNLVMFAVTNLSTLKNPENAKNLLAVGATQAGASANNFCSGGAGPTADGRRKPEIFAPGCGISSASTGACSTTSLTGTSMASPAITGGTALIRQYFTEGWYPTGAKVAGNAFTPTGALLKAVAINSGQDMTGISGYPSNGEGWGRMELDTALAFTADARKLIVKDVRKSVGVTTGQSKVYNFNVTSNTQRLAITLAFHDFPGTANASNPVINDLNLTLTAPGGVTYRGNVFSGGFSTTGGTADAKNNVERILINSPAVGAYTVTIHAQSVPQGPQGFGLAINGAVSESAPGPAISTLSPNPVAIANQFAVPVLTVNGSGFTGAQNVKIGPDTYTDITIVSDTQITVKFIPPPSVVGTQNVTVTTPSGTSPGVSVTTTAPTNRFVFFSKNPINDGEALTIYMASPNVGFTPLLAYSQCLTQTPIPPYVTYSIGGCGDFNFTPDPLPPFAVNGISSYSLIVPVGSNGSFFLQFSEINLSNPVFPLNIGAIGTLTIQ